MITKTETTPPLTFGFDVYGTLIDTHGVVVELEQYIGDLAATFSQIWREKQLEYTFRRGLMQSYEPFGICTKQALEFVNQHLQCGLSEAQLANLIECYRTLPAFTDAPTGLEAMKQSGAAIYAFSNGQAHAVEHVLRHADILHYFDGIVSVDEIKTFKPDPRVYEHFIARTQANLNTAWLVSSNGFDVIGAIKAGMKAAWIQRNPSLILDPWEISPTITLTNLLALPKTAI